MPTPTYKYPRNMNHKPNSTAIFINISKYMPIIELEVTNINYGEVEIINIPVMFQIPLTSQLMELPKH